MGRRPKGSWPGTPAEIRDRDRVVTLVRRVGKNRLTFTTQEIRREMNTLLPLQLENSGDLWRHLKALEGDLVVEVGRRDFGAGSESTNGRSRKKYALRSRLPDLDREAEPVLVQLDDVERAQQALWVALKASGAAEVSTRLVTDVLKNVEPLAPTRAYRTHNLLKRLAERPHPAAEKVDIEGERWCRWRPVGERPDYPDFGSWLKRFKALQKGDQDLVRLGQATVNEVGRELVRLTVRARSSSTYPHGQSARLPHVRELAGGDPKAKRLAASVRRRARSLRQVIIDTAREVVVGQDRVDVRIARIRGPITGNVYYDVPDEPGFEQRRLIVGLQELRHALREGVLERIAEDQREARMLPSLYPRAGIELDAVIAARGVLGQRELEELEAVLREVATMEHSFSAGIRTEIAEHRNTFKHFLGRGAWTGDEQEVFTETAEQLGIGVSGVLAAQRPLIRPDEYVSWLPAQHVADYTPSELMAMAATVRRFVNPDYTYRRDPDPDRRYYLLADRMEALAYAAEKVMARVAAPLAAGARLLGRNLRSAEFVRALGDSADPTLRRDAMSALALLGDSGAQHIGLDLLNTPGTPSDAIASVLWVLHMTGALNARELPRHVRSNRSWIVSSALREVILAQAHGRALI